MQLRRLEAIEADIAALDQRIGERLEPYSAAHALLMQIPGVDWVVAAVLIAEVGDGSGLADLVEIGFAEVAVGQVFGEHVIGGDEDLVGDGEGGAQAAPAGLEAMEFVLEVAPLGSRRRHRGADQDRAEVDVAFARPAALLPAGALVGAGADAGQADRW